MHNVPTSIDVSGLGIPDDGQKILSELMSFYDGNLHHGRTFPCGNLHNVQGQVQHHPASKFQQDDDFFKHKQGAESVEIFQETSPLSSSSIFPSTESEYDQYKSYNTTFANNVGENNSDFRFGSPLNFTPADYSIDPLMSKQEVSLWYL